MRVVAFLLAALLGVGAALLVGCGDRSELIPPRGADRLVDALDGVQAAVAAGDCAQTGRALLAARNALVNVPPSVDPRLRARLGQGVENLEAIAPRACQARAQPTEEPTTTTEPETTETDTTPTTPPTETTTEPTPTEPTPTEPTPTEHAPTDGSGGVAPEAGTP